MNLHPVDWAVILGYLLFAISVGLWYARRASQNVDEFFLSGRRLPWWIAGTSMVATTYAADTPLVVSGWVRDFGVWKNWLWWCYAIGGLMTAFLFARYWRRLGVMTTAELAEARYGGAEARVLRGFLGFYHAGVTNVIVLSWVLLAAVKIIDVLFGVDPVWAVTLVCALALGYSLLSGFWGVVVTDVVQFVMAMVGSIALAVMVWNAIGGQAGFADAVASGVIPASRVDFVPPAGAGGPFDASFWTVSFAAFAVYLGVAWWATDAVDGGSYIVQRISACRDERHGVLAQLWYNVAHHALRPWPWIVVALASLVVLPHEELTSPVDGRVVAVAMDDGRIEIAPDGGGEPIQAQVDTDAEWHPHNPRVSIGDAVRTGDVLAVTDSERAYPAMMLRYLPVGLLGLVIASLIAALMSTIDTHVILASSYFVNDFYRRFLAPDRSDRHYVLAGRLAGVVIMALGGLVAVNSESIKDLFTFFLAFLGGVGPIYLLRWLWWRVRAVTEITAMLTSSITTVVLTSVDATWNLGPLTAGGDLSAEARLCIVAGLSLTAALLATFIAPRPDPARLVPFYRRVRPAGAWGPVRDAAGVAARSGELPVALIGTLSAVAFVYAMLFGIGSTILGRTVTPFLATAAVTLVVSLAALRWLHAAREENGSDADA